LQRATELLAKELVRPSAIAPDWSETEWAVARAVASIHGISALLAEALQWQGPGDWSDFLAQQRTHTGQRFYRIEQLLQQVDRSARSDGIAFVALKGAALHASGIYAPGERPMADIDLLVRTADSQPAARLITSLGFRETARSWKDVVFEQTGAPEPATLGEHSTNGIKIELHSHVRERLPLRAVDITEMVFPRHPHPGLNPYASKGALLSHLLLHAAGGLVSRELRLLHLHDIARLMRSMKDTEWDEVLGPGSINGAGRPWWAFPPLSLAARYCEGVPDAALRHAASCCHGWLKRVYRHRSVSDASLSYLWVNAFPGIEWSRSARELLQYAAVRLIPSAETLRQRRQQATTDPRVCGGPWAELSQSQRVLRWILSRQPRQAALQPILAALGALAS
jgi:hypothetical protein